MGLCTSSTRASRNRKCIIRGFAWNHFLYPRFPKQALNNELDVLDVQDLGSVSVCTRKKPLKRNSSNKRTRKFSARISATQSSNSKNLASTISLHSTLWTLPRQKQ